MFDNDAIVIKKIDIEADKMTGLFHVPDDSLWFSGHFPGHPILPAIALIEVVAKTLGGDKEKNKAGLLINKLKRVRFRQGVLPGEDILVTIIPDDGRRKGRYRFKIVSQEKTISEGVFFAADHDPKRFPPPVTNLRGSVNHMVNIEKYLPHRGRMKFVDNIFSHDKNSDNLIGATVKADWPLQTQDKGVSPIILIELAAQATAVMMGLEEELNDQRQSNLGYIVGIKEAVLAREYIQIGSELIIMVQKKLWQDNYGIFNGSVSGKDRLYGEVQLQVFRPDKG